MKSLIKPFRDIGFLTIALTLALAANFAYGQWSNPPASPPNNNVAAPLNIGAAAQTKDGDLNVGNRLTVSGNWPTFHLIDLNSTNIYRHLVRDNGQLSIQRSVGYGPFSPEALLLNPASNGTGYALFENQVRAVAYCDENGANCIDIADVGTATSTPGGSPDPAQWVDGADLGSNSNFEQICPAGEVLVGLRIRTIHACPGSCGYNTGPTEEIDMLCAPISAAVGAYPVAPPTWSTGNWSACSATSCGQAGTQTRTVRCEDSAGNLVPDSNCSGSKPASSQACSGYCPPPDNTCFIAGTEVKMADGSSKDIEDVLIGEQVLGTNGSINTVLGYDRPMLGSRLLYSFNNGPFFVTAEHPFLTTDGWKSISVPALIAEDAELAKKLQVTTLEVGDQILKSDGSTEIIHTILSKSAPDQRLYNLMLDGNNTYHADEYVTHNKAGDL